MRTLMMIGLAAAVALSAADSDACSCAPNPPPKQAMERAAAVFTAKVVKINDDDGGKFTRNVTLEVIKTWKGTNARSVTVVTAKDGAACGYGFEVGKTYIVYCHGDAAGTLPVGLCSRTAPIERAGDDLKELGEGKAPGDK
jgi:hypothetical protein